MGLRNHRRGRDACGGVAAQCRWHRCAVCVTSVVRRRDAGSMGVWAAQRYDVGSVCVGYAMAGPEESEVAVVRAAATVRGTEEGR